MKVEYIVFIVILMIGIMTTISCFCWSPLRALETFQSPMKFLTKEEALSVIENDHDDFLKRFFPADLHARQVSSIEEYVKKASDVGLSDFTEDEKKKVESAVAISKEILKEKQESWFDGEKASRDPWKFAKTTVNYEEGLPHTRGDVIFISTKNLEDDIHILSDTLSHEKIHVYQKSYPEELLSYLSLMGFSKKRKREEKDLIRVNPDTDNFVYKLNGVEMAGCAYRSKYPGSILDVENRNQYFEHPFERQVFDILRK